MTRALLLALAALTGAAAAAGAQSAFDAPPYANAGVAVTGDAGGLFVNPAAAGLERGAELALSVSGAPLPDGTSRRNALDHALYRGALALGSVGFTLAYPERGRVSYGASLAGGGPALRLGLGLQSLTPGAYAAALARGHAGARAEGAAAPSAGETRAADWRAGALARPMPWLSLGAVVDHAGEPRLAGGRLDREYVLGLGVRPLAWSGPLAHTLGTRLTIGADVRLREGEPSAAAGVRVGGELELVSGVAVRGAVEDHGGVRLGLSLLGGRSGVHFDSEDCAGCGDPAGSVTASFHAAEERTALAALEPPRVATVRVGGTLADDALTSVSVFENEATTAVAPIRRQLERAAADPRTRGVLLDIGGLGGMAQIEELRPKIAALRAARKPVVAYLEYGGRRPDLFLAAACDAIVTSPESFWAGLGLHSERRYYRKALADWGVRIDRTSYGKYKSAYRNFSVDSTSGADRESIERGLDVVEGLFNSAVARDRRISEDRLRTVLDGRAWRPEDLAKLAIVDSVGYRDDALRMLGRLAGLGPRPRTVDLRKLPEARREWRVPRPIAVVYASGDIEVGKSGNDLLNGAFMGSQTMARAIEAAFRNPEVKAVVLRIDSPGGSSVASDLIFHAADRMKRETHKPLIVSMGRYAASGGYHIAMAGDRLYADRFTITGSIGVLSVRYSLEGWLRKHAVRQDDFDRGEFMRGWSTGHDWDARVQAAADSATWRDYRAFVELVARHRGMTWDSVHAVAQGRVWMGEDALERRLVDSIGGLDAALAEARRRAGIPDGEKIALAEYRRPRPALLQGLLGTWVRDQWRQSIHLPEAGEIRRGMDPDALTIE